MGPVSHVKEEEGGRGVVGLTWMHDARRGTSSSPCTGLVTWPRGVVLVCCGVAVCLGCVRPMVVDRGGGCGQWAALGVVDGRDGGGWKTTIVCC